MNADTSTLWTLGAIAVGASAAWGWFSDKSLKVKDNEHNRRLRESLEAERRKLDEMVVDARAVLDKERALAERALSERAAYLTAIRTNFDEGMLQGRRWLAAFIAEADRTYDESIARRLTDKARPALKASEEVAAARAERRIFRERAVFLEYQLRSLKEYFPFIEEFEEELLDESVPLASDDEPDHDSDGPTDPARRYLSEEEFAQLSSAQRSQLALDRYLNGPMSTAAVGRLYEQSVGYEMEQEGWAVDYHGIRRGLEDLGRDLICTRGNAIKVVQAKCWSRSKLIHEKHVFQLFGTTQHYRMEAAKRDLFEPAVSARFVTSTTLSPIARQAADMLGVEVIEQRPLTKDFPMIKCNVNQQTGARIYHLPFDHQYKRTTVLAQLGECQVKTAAEAEALGFRRAYRYRG